MHLAVPMYKILFFIVCHLFPFSLLAQQATSFPSQCGNGLVEAGETCNDSNQINNDGCSSLCQREAQGSSSTPQQELSICGDGAQQIGEECDDGNRAVGDDCGLLCLVERCGNQVVDPGEFCDGDSACTIACGNSHLRAKDPSIALAYSLTSTVLGSSLLGLGLVVGPSAGHIYAREYKHAVLTSSIRLLSGLLMLDGIAGNLCFSLRGKNAPLIPMHSSEPQWVEFYWVAL
jgi:cysteine-rich repeat protein